MKEKISKLFDSHNISKKQIWMGVFFSLTSLLFWLGIFWALSSRITDAVLLVAIFLTGILWITALVVIILFLDKKAVYVSFGILLLTLVSLFGFGKYTILGIILFGIILWIAYIRVERIKNSLAQFKALFLARRFFTIFFTGLAVLLAFIYSSYILSDYSIDDFHVSESVYHILFIPIETSLRIVIPKYKKGMTVGELQEVLVDNFLTRFLPEKDTQIDVPQGINFNQETEFSPMLYGDVINMTLEQFSLNWINTSVAIIVEPYKDILPVFFIVGLFSVIKFLLWPLKWLSLIFIWLAIKLLMLYSIISIKETQILIKIPVIE